MISFSHTGEKSWVPIFKVISDSLSSALSAAVGPRAAGTAVVLPARLPPGRQSLSVFNKLCSSLKPLCCDCCSYCVTLRSTLNCIHICVSVGQCKSAQEELFDWHIWNWGKALLSPGVLRGIALCNLLPSFRGTELGQGWGEGPLPAEQQQRIWPVYVLGQSHLWWFSDKAFNSFYWCNNWSPNSAAWDAARHFQWAQIK